MSEQQLTNVSNTIGDGESLESVVEVNIKTLDSQIFSFQVDKNMLVLQFKEKIANEVGLPVEQQRLIFRGKVLKDDHALSEYHVDSGHTLHLVARQPSEFRAPFSTSSGETSSNNGQDPNPTGLPSRIGHISHSVVLGSLNVGDQGEGIVPDISRVIGAVLNSIGIGNHTATNSMGAANVVGGTQPNLQVHVPQGNQTEGTQTNTGTQGQAGVRAQPGQTLPSQSLPQVLQIPVGAVIPVPSLNVPIPDSLRTLSEFMSRMELPLSRNGVQPNQSENNNGDHSVDLPLNAGGLPTPEALAVVLRHAQHLLGDHAVSALSHIAGRLEQEGDSTDIAVRSQIQTESVQLGLAMQHLGSLLLELGRTMLTLHMGQSPAEAYVNAGPAVYISSSGPNPIMVQPFPLQTNSLFGGSSAPSNPVNLGPIGNGSVPRHVNIHIHTAVGPRAVSTADGPQGGLGSHTAPGASQTRARHPRNVIAAVIPSRTSVTIPHASQTAVSVSRPPPESDEISTVAAEVNSLIRGPVGNMQNGSQAESNAVVPSRTSVTLPHASQSVVSASQPPPGSDEISTVVAEINSLLGGPVGNMQNGSQAESDGQVENSAVQNLFSRAGADNDTADNQIEVLAGGELNSSVLGDKPDTTGEKVSLEGLQSNDEEISLMSSKDVPQSSQDGGCNDLQNDEAPVKSVSASECGPMHGQKGGDAACASAVPLGLGMGGLQPKTRRQQRTQNKASDGTNPNASDQIHQAVMNGQHVLQSLASRTNRSTNYIPSSEQPLAGLKLTGGHQTGGQVADDQIDVANAMSEVLHNPAISGLLGGVSQQTGFGSPDSLRDIMGQFMRSPEMRNTVNQIAQQFNGQNVGNLFTGRGGGPGGGLDLAGLVQQMMPIVSQALGGETSPLQQPLSSVMPDQPESNVRSSSIDERASDPDSQVDLQPVVQRIENQSPPDEIFRSLVATVTRSYEGGGEGHADEIYREESLANDFMEVLRHDVRERLEREKGPSDRS